MRKPTTTPQKVIEGIGAAISIGIHIVLGALLRPWRSRWGATPGELERPLPGDDQIRRRKWGYTRAITIQALPEKVWPWLAQIGQGRGGFYSYEWLENLVGCEIYNTEAILPEFQRLQAGDAVRMHPKAPPIPLIGLEEGRWLLLGAPPRYENPDAKYIGSTWLLFLEAVDGGSTRLIARGRNDYSAGMANELWAGPHLLEPISFVMERKMLLEIKRLAEANA